MGLGCEDVILHFLVERREGECQRLASQDTGLVNDWVRTRVFWLLLGQCSFHFILPLQTGGSPPNLSSNPFIYLSERNVSLKSKNEDQKLSHTWKNYFLYFIIHSNIFFSGGITKGQREIETKRSGKIHPECHMCPQLIGITTSYCGFLGYKDVFTNISRNMVSTSPEIWWHLDKIWARN